MFQVSFTLLDQPLKPSFIDRHKPYLLGIQYNLGELTSLCKTLDYFVGDIGSEVNTEGQGGIHCFH